MSLSISIDKSHFHELFSILKLSKDLLNHLNEIIQQQTDLLQYLYQFNSIDKQFNHLRTILNNYFHEINRNEIEINEIIKQYQYFSLKSNQIMKYEINLRKETSFYPNLENAILNLNILIKDKCLLSTNDQYLLINTNNQLNLFDRNYRLLKKIFLKEKIHDICWSLTLNKFFLVSSKDLFELNPNEMLIKSVRLTYKSCFHWNRLCFSMKYLFVSQCEINSYLYKFQLFPTIQFCKRFQKEIYSHKNQYLNNLKYFDKKIYLLIEDNLNNECFIQIHLLKTFEIEKKICLGFGWNYQLTLFNNQYLILADNYNQRIIYLDFHGEILKIDKFTNKINELVSWFNHQLIIQTNEYISIYQSL